MVSVTYTCIVQTQSIQSLFWNISENPVNVLSIDEATECIRAVWTSWGLRSNREGNGGRLLSDLGLGAALRTARPFSSQGFSPPVRRGRISG